MLIDRFGRKVDGFRISVTNRCNYNCFFCHREGVFTSSIELKPSDWGFFAEVGVELGITEYKLTGGEPLLRGDIVDITKMIRDAGGSVSITTNGSLLSRYARELVNYVDHVNVSLHSLDPELFNKITNGRLDDTINGLKLAKETGMRVKLNYVVTTLNTKEFYTILRFAEENGFDLNVIELIPLGLEKDEWARLHVDLSTIESFLEERSIRISTRELHERVMYFLPSGIKVSVIKGFCNPVHCMHCTRLRVTPSGVIKTCLYGGFSIDSSSKNIVERNRKGLIDDIQEAVLMREPFFK